MKPEKPEVTRMRLLFTIDTKDYDSHGTVCSRPSARAVIIREGKLAMMHSKKYGYYKLPGGGIKPGETPADAMIRETAEEAGLTVIPDSIHEFGRVHRIQHGDREDVFIQDNFYFLCDAETDAGAQNLDAYERDEGFTLCWVTPEDAIRADLAVRDPAADLIMCLREVNVLRILMHEGLFA